MTAKICLACNRPIKGRTDKKFCNDSCRNNYNNRLNSDTTPLMRNINNILRKNRRILMELLSGTDKQATVLEKEKLAEKGFHFEFFTERFENDRNEVYYYSYDYGYRFLDEEKYMVVKDNRKKFTAAKKQPSIPTSMF